MYTGLQRGKEMKTSSCRQLSTQPVGSTRVTECPSYASLSVPSGFSPWSRTEDPQQKHCFLCVLLFSNTPSKQKCVGLEDMRQTTNQCEY